MLEKKKYDQVIEKIKETEKLNNIVTNTSIDPIKINPILIEKKSSPLKQKVKAPSIISRPFITIGDVIKSNEKLSSYISDFSIKKNVLEQVEINMKYKGYINREKDNAEKIKRLEHVGIPENINYDKFSSLSAESKEKLKSIMPKDIAQASRISGIKPSDISILLVYLGR